MAGKSKARKNLKKPSGPISDSQAKKTKSMDEVLGVLAMEIESGDEGHQSEVEADSLVDENEEILSPRTSLNELKSRSEAHRTFSLWLSVMNSRKRQNQVTPIPILQPGCDENVVCIELDDIQDEVDCWNSAIICDVLGANPPLSIFEGFRRRIWKDLGIDKVVNIEHGVFVVRFFTMENRDKVLDANRLTFDKKPVICKPWHKDIVDLKDEVKGVPIWIHLNHLDLKFWGNRSLSKIVGSIGEFIQDDQATINMDKLQFA
ncbi:uncharacterized protein [Spinacia oleracea]|uniref:DUF4283 domain-containing protein n=1 Tax=Spinacia oleracea TaxID=3562 RepID=A0A9R0K4V8_SPIOL|nr:uncharacterized protein LOC110796845 [Spinacia oleracea]